MHHTYIFIWFCPCSPSPGILPTITPLGFQFLLLSQPAQIWAFITKYLQSLQVGSCLPPSYPLLTLTSPAVTSAGQRDECGGVHCVSHADQLCHCWKSKAGFSMCNMGVYIHTTLCEAEPLPLCQAYSVEGLPPSQLQVIQHLREFGLVYQRKVRFMVAFGSSS